MKRPSFHLYPADWLQDQAMSACSAETRGVWIDLLCRMALCDKNDSIRGTASELARLTRCLPHEFESAAVELMAAGVPGILKHGDEYEFACERLPIWQPRSATEKLRVWVRRNYRWIVAQIRDRDGYQCRRCKTTTDLQVDHIRPLAKGGGNELENLGFLCGQCNRRKHAKVEGRG